MEKLIYNYDPKTGALLSATAAERSPLDAESVYLVPAYATDIAPPEAVAGTCPVFDRATQTWARVPDARGTYYDKVTGAPATITALGILPENEGLTDLAPPAGHARFVDGAWEPDLAATKAKCWENIKAERDRRGDVCGYRVDTHWFHSDPRSRGQQLGLVLLGANIPAGLQWKTMDGGFVAMTPTLAQQILAAGAASDWAIFSAAEAHRVAMEASADPAAYDFSGGWPAGFGE